MQAQLNYGVCEYPFSTQFVTQMTNLVQLMNTATASNSYSAWNNFYTAVSVSLLPTWGALQRALAATAAALCV